MDPASASLEAVVDAAFAPGGPLSRAVTEYEPRPGQRAMAGAVTRAIEQGRVLLAEAGTGTGKTLAYLVTALLSGRRVLVSTGTKTLQDQIYEEDLDDLRAALGLEVLGHLPERAGATISASTASNCSKKNPPALRPRPTRRGPTLRISWGRPQVHRLIALSF